MNAVDKNKTLAELIIEGTISSEKANYLQTETIEEYLIKKLDIDPQMLSENQRTLLSKNFIHLICLVIDDIALVNGRLHKYQDEYHKHEKEKSNASEYFRRKLEYFCTINKNARTEILDFLGSKLKTCLLENDFDTLKREQEGDELSELFMKRRYVMAQFPEFYDLGYNFSTVVKTAYFPVIDPMEIMTVEKEFLALFHADKKKYIKRLHNVVDNNKIMDNMLVKVEYNYHLNKRLEIFRDLARAFSEKHFQSFMSLGLLQLEGLFYDLCLIKYGTKDNMGTLVEKVQKSLQGKNEYNFMKFYPYFAFDIPILRNEIAHKGILETMEIEDSAYNLVLDLNTVISMVKSESYHKFNIFIMTHEKMIKFESDNPEAAISTQKVYQNFLNELIGSSVVANESFWTVLKKPERFKEEIKFYKPPELEDGYIDLEGIVSSISVMIRQREFWEELLRAVNESRNPIWKFNRALYNFAKRLKNDYISELEDDAKQYCIEVSKLLDCF